MSSLTRKRTLQSKEDTILKDIAKKLIEGSLTNFEEDDSILDLVLSTLKSKSNRSWRTCIYGTRILLFLIYQCPLSTIGTKLMEREGIQILLSVLGINGGVLEGHKTEEVRQNVLELLSNLAQLELTHQLMVEECQIVSILFTLYQSQGSSAAETVLGQGVLKIFIELFKGTYKENILQSGIDKILLKKNLKKFPIREKSFKKSAMYKSPPKISTTTPLLPSITSAVPLIPTPITERGSLSWKPDLPSERNLTPSSSRRTNTTEVEKIRENPTLPPLPDDVYATKTMRRKSAPTQESKLNGRLLHLIPGGGVGASVGSGLGTSTTQPDKDTRHSPKKRTKRSKSTRVSQNYLDTSIDTSKTRVKCRWDDDLRFIWVDRNISVLELTKVIESEYRKEVPTDQMKYSDPADKDDLMTITKREDIELCFDRDKPEIYIFSNPNKAYGFTPSKFQSAQLPLPSPLRTSSSGQSPSSSGTILSSRTSSTSKKMGLTQQTSNSPRSRGGSLRREHTDGPSISAEKYRSNSKSKQEKNTESEVAPTNCGTSSPSGSSGSGGGATVSRKNDEVISRNSDPGVLPQVKHKLKTRSRKHTGERHHIHNVIADLNTATGAAVTSPAGAVPSGTPLTATNSGTSGAIDPRWIIKIQDLKISEEPSLGGGFFGEVKLGYWRGMPVACKFVFEKSFRKKSEEELFDQEVKILSSLRHPNVILYMGVCLDKEKIIVMEYMDNGSVHELLRKRVLDIHEIWKIAREIALGMNYLHGQNILHRDLTSKNILLSKHMEAKVADFGLSKMKLIDSQAFSYTMGSVAWMAPEVIKNASLFTRPSDVYSYGILLWELWTGEDPCPREIAVVNLANKVLNEDYRPTIPEGVPANWKQLTSQCWSNNPPERPTFESVLEILSEENFVPLIPQQLKYSHSQPQHSPQVTTPQTSPPHSGQADSLTSRSLPLLSQTTSEDEYSDMLGSDLN